MKKMDDPRYPLTWPFGWKRTPAKERRASDFREAGSTQRNRLVNGKVEYYDTRVTRQVTVRTASQRLQDQLERLGAEEPLLSTNLSLTVGGEPRADRKDPDDPGAAVYFKLKGHDRVLACDKWRSVAENIAALAAHIDAIRRVDRYGVGTMEQAFAGYDALPPPSSSNRPAWRKILGFKEFSPVTPDDVRLNYRALAKLAPNDEGRLMELNLARDQALVELHG